MFDFDVVTGSAGQFPSEQAKNERRPGPEDMARSGAVGDPVGSPIFSSLPGLIRQSMDPRVKPGGDETIKGPTSL